MPSMILLLPAAQNKCTLVSSQIDGKAFPLFDGVCILVSSQIDGKALPPDGVWCQAFCREAGTDFVIRTGFQHALKCS